MYTIHSLQDASKNLRKPGMSSRGVFGPFSCQAHYRPLGHFRASASLRCITIVSKGLSVVLLQMPIGRCTVSEELVNQTGEKERGWEDAWRIAVVA